MANQIIQRPRHTIRGARSNSEALVKKNLLIGYVVLSALLLGGPLDTAGFLSFLGIGNPDTQTSQIELSQTVSTQVAGTHTISAQYTLNGDSVNDFYRDGHLLRQSLRCLRVSRCD